MRHTLLAVFALALASLLPAREAVACTYDDSEDCTVFSWTAPGDFPSNAHLAVGSGCVYDDPHYIQLWRGNVLQGELTSDDLLEPRRLQAQSLGDHFGVELNPGSAYQLKGGPPGASPNEYVTLLEIDALAATDAISPWLAGASVETGPMPRGPCRCPDECDDEPMLGLRLALAGAGDDRTNASLLRSRLDVWLANREEPAITRVPDHYGSLLSEGGALYTSWDRSPYYLGPEGERYLLKYRVILMDGSGNVSEPVYGEVESEWPDPVANDDDDDDSTPVAETGGSDGGSCSQAGGSGFSAWWGLLVVVRAALRKIQRGRLA